MRTRAATRMRTISGGGYLIRGDQRTWHSDDLYFVIAPGSAHLSFDGTTWVSIDSLANEPETGKINRTPE